MSWREKLWLRIMDLHAKLDAMKGSLDGLPPSPEIQPLRARFSKAYDALVEARGAHSHGEWAFFSWLRLGPLEQSARELAADLAWQTSRMSLEDNA